MVLTLGTNIKAAIKLNVIVCLIFIVPDDFFSDNFLSVSNYEVLCYHSYQ